MEKTITVLNSLRRDGVLDEYAIGGAIALLFYTEPVTTYDLDVFCLLPEREGSLATLAPIYDHLRRHGYAADREHVVIEGIPVQFIPAYNELVREAVEQAVERPFKNVPVRVLRLEHLLAIMVQTGRAKDRARASQVMEETKPDEAMLSATLARHGLLAKWQRWRENPA